MKMILFIFFLAPIMALGQIKSQSNHKQPEFYYLQGGILININDTIKTMVEMDSTTHQYYECDQVWVTTKPNKNEIIDNYKARFNKYKDWEVEDMINTYSIKEKSLTKQTEKRAELIQKRKADEAKLIKKAEDAADKILKELEKK